MNILKKWYNDQFFQFLGCIINFWVVNVPLTLINNLYRNEKLDGLKEKMSLGSIYCLLEKGLINIKSYEH